MWWAAAIQGGLALFGASKQAAAGKDAKRLADQNVAMSKSETAESLRRHTREGEQRVGYATAVAGASGFSIQKGTSQDNYISEMVAENRRQREFIAQSGWQEQKRLRLGGQRAASQASSAALSSVGGAIGMFGEAYSMWNA